uniref:CUB domain-containing protein n=1 Tax=Panagrellus redivivus TaxID=6233 RepID=A0A7E4W7D5_PANRE
MWATTVLISFLAFVSLTLASAPGKLVKKASHKPRIPERSSQEGYGFTGCPLDNDFWTNGVIASPYYPSPYPNDIKCWYYIWADIGKVLQFNFTHFDLDGHLDYITIYDGYGDSHPILFGGPNATVTSPNGVLYSSSRYALMTFIATSNKPATGFQLSYSSVNTATPCNRDILLVINGLASVGSQANFVKQLDFIATYLISEWTVGAQQTRVTINLQIDVDYAVLWTFDMVPDLSTLRFVIRGLTDYVPDVLQNNGTDFESLFRYGDDDEAGNDFNARQGIEQVVIVFVAQNPSDDQDFYEAVEFSHRMRHMYDLKVITIAMGSNIDVQKVGQLSFGNGFYFGAAWDNLKSLTQDVNKAICQSYITGCGV